MVFLQYDVEEAKLPSRTLWFSVWDWDRLGKNEFLGEVMIPLSTIDLKNCRNQVYALQDSVSYLANEYCT